MATKAELQEELLETTAQMDKLEKLLGKSQDKMLDMAAIIDDKDERIESLRKKAKSCDVDTILSPCRMWRNIWFIIALVGIVMFFMK